MTDWKKLKRSLDEDRKLLEEADKNLPSGEGMLLLRDWLAIFDAIRKKCEAPEECLDQCARAMLRAEDLKRSEQHYRQYLGQWRDQQGFALDTPSIGNTMAIDTGPNSTFPNVFHQALREAHREGRKRGKLVLCIDVLAREGLVVAPLIHAYIDWAKDEPWLRALECRVLVTDAGGTAKLVEPMVRASPQGAPPARPSVTIRQYPMAAEPRLHGNIISSRLEKDTERTWHTLFMGLLPPRGEDEERYKELRRRSPYLPFRNRPPVRFFFEFFQWEFDSWWIAAGAPAKNSSAQSYAFTINP